MPKVSIIIPCYNYARFLSDAVESVRQQSYKDLEIVIVNDGSTDQTADVAEELAKRFSDLPIRVIHQHNQGLPKSRNNAIEKASGVYILPLDADDLIEPDYLHETTRILDQDDSISIAYTLVKIVDLERNTENFPIGEEYNFDLLLEKNILPVTSLYRKSAWEKIGGYKLLKGYADWEFWIALGSAGYKGKLVKKTLYVYRKHGNSMIDNSTMIHERLFSEIRRLHPHLYGTEILERIIASMGTDAEQLRNRLRQTEAELLSSRLELIDLRSGRGSMKNILKQIARRFFK